MFKIYSFVLYFIFKPIYTLYDYTLFVTNKWSVGKEKPPQIILLTFATTLVKFCKGREMYQVKCIRIPETRLRSLYLLPSLSCGRCFPHFPNPPAFKIWCLSKQGFWFILQIFLYINSLSKPTFLKYTLFIYKMFIDNILDWLLLEIFHVICFFYIRLGFPWKQGVNH